MSAFTFTWQVKVKVKVKGNIRVKIVTKLKNSKLCKTQNSNFYDNPN